MGWHQATFFTHPSANAFHSWPPASLHHTITQPDSVLTCSIPSYSSSGLQVLPEISIHQAQMCFDIEMNKEEDDPQELSLSLASQL